MDNALRLHGALPRTLALLLGLAAAACNAPAPAQTQNFGTATLKPGESRTIPIRGFHGYVPVRVCNDYNSQSNVSVTVRPRDPHLLMPGQCAEDTGDQIEMLNKGGGPAAVSWQPPPGFFFRDMQLP